MRIYLFLQNEIKLYRLPNEISGSFMFDPENSDSKLINIDSKLNKWYIHSTSNVSLIYENNIINEKELVPNQYYILRRDNKNYLIFTEEGFSSNLVTFAYNNNINLIIGKTNNSNLILDIPYINNDVARIYYKDNRLILEHKNNTPIYVNNKLVKIIEYNINYGDIINIYGLKLTIFNQILLINNLSFLKVKYEQTNLVKFNYTQEEAKNIEIKDRNLYDKNDYFSKAPRIRRTIEEKEIEFSSPPSTQLSQGTSLLMTLGPMFTMGLMSFITIFNTIDKVYTGQAELSDCWINILSSGLMLTSTMLWPIISNKYQKNLEKKNKEKQVEKYKEYLKDKEKEFQEEMNLQRSIIIENLITLQECLSIINNKTVNFWDKRLDQNDIMQVRIGIGNDLLKVNISYPEEGFTTDENELKKLSDALVNRYKYINNIPISYSFFENITTAIMGNIYKCYGLIDNILLQLLTFYSYEDLKIVIFTKEDKKDRWEYIKYLNHNFTNGHELRFFACTQDDYRLVAGYLAQEISMRKNQNQSNSEDLPDFKPYYFIITDDYETLKNYELVNLISEEEKNLDASLVIIEERLSKLPSKCNNFINLGEKTSGVLRNSFDSQEQIVFNDEINYKIDMMQVSKVLANIPIEFEDGQVSLPEAISFMEMEQVGKVEQLNILNRWNTNDATTSLKAEIGVDESGQLFYLDLHEKAHGPHGLVAGMTGSGKSEFIITYILSMCMNYSPDDIAFILIDYKGGGLAGAFENQVTGVRLPHLTGTITNLDKAEMDRTLVSIDSEAKRRQAKFNEARDNLGESTIDIYKYQKFYKEGKLTEPIPHLFIICDEFAELKSQQPDFMDNLISIARIGRSLGIHLILATQKPSGVVNDQIWSNAKFHVCLKVQDAGDSKEMIKRPDAAALKEAGRFYLQVGYDEFFAMGQSAWCGAKYYPSNEVVKEVDKSVNFINDTGQIIKSIQAAKKQKIEPKGEQIAAILQEIINISKKTNKHARRLWLPNIPPIILVDNLIKKYNVDFKDSIKAVIGEVDVPAEQKQDILTYDLIKDGNSLIYGTDGQENEMVLNSILYSLTTNYSPETINYYIFDFGSSNFRIYSKMPHCGGVVLPGEDEKYLNLLKLLSKEKEIRKEKLAETGLNYETYLKKNNDIPLIFVVINQYDTLNEFDKNMYESIPQLIRDSEQLGIVFTISLINITTLPSRARQTISTTYTLKLKDDYEYANALNTRGRIFPRNIFGRGICNIGTMNEYQTASIVEDSNMLNNTLIEKSNELSNIFDKKARKIPELPKQIKEEDLPSEETKLNDFIIGMNKSTLEYSRLDLTTNLGNLFVSNKLKNIKAYAKSIIKQVHKIKNQIAFIIDTTKLLEKEFQDNYYDETENLISYVEKTIDNFKDTATIILIIIGMNDFYTKIENKEKIKEIFDKLSKLNNKTILIFDTAKDINKIKYEDWFSKNVNCQEGLWIGNGASDQNIFKYSQYSKELSQQVKNNMGYLFQDGGYKTIKLLEFEKSDDSE